MIRLSDQEEQQAQSIACAHLIRGCEGAVSELVSVTGEAAGRSPTEDRAHDILAQVLASWRDALVAVSLAAPLDTGATEVSNLDRWTSDELFAETLKRRAGDVPALGVMQGLTLQAQLTAHDEAINSTAQATLMPS